MSEEEGKDYINNNMTDEQEDNKYFTMIYKLNIDKKENNKNKSSNFSSSSKIVKIIQKRNMISKLIENKDNEKAKKLKLAIQIDLPSFDLEQEKLNINEENEDIQQIRKDYITELNIKNMRMLKKIIKNSKKR